MKFIYFIFGIIFFISDSIICKPNYHRRHHQKPIQNDDNLLKTCGYQSCPKPIPNMLNVHIVPHTHDDVGWLKTVDQYYYGSQTQIQKAGVQYIIDSVIQELLKDPKKKFIYVESAFFFKWWKEQTDELKEKVKMLVNEGRLEFIGGAWSMNDEATTHYQSIIDQFAWGLRALNDTFGECARPKIGWQIDPFGHSREMASIFAQMGYDGLFFGRLDYEDKQKRLLTKTAEMVWKASPNLGESSDLFTGALYNQYQPPPGFCFDILCADEPIIDGKHSPDNNVDRRIREFFNYVEVMSETYGTNNLLITMGEDFNYQDANMWYKNLDKLIKYGNEKQQTNNSDINLFYSTPSCYLKALHDANQTWPIKEDDFFPYGSDPNSYWTGYFTSRPTLKRYERVGNHFLQICKQLTAISHNSNDQKFTAHLNFMRETMGIMQHHDAITGTEKQKVAFDYAKRLDVGLRACHSNTKDILNQIVTGHKALPINSTTNENNPKLPAINNENKENKETTTENDQFHMNIPHYNYTFDFNSCPLLNISECAITENNNEFIVTVYNPLARSIYEYIRIPVASQSYQVTDYRGIKIPSQIVTIPSTIDSLKFRQANAKYELAFLASELPPMGFKSYYIQKNDNQSDIITKSILLSDTNVIGFENLKLTFNQNGLLEFIETGGVKKPLQQEFAYYKGAMGNNYVAKNRSSGAYIFRPNGTNTIVLGNNSANIEIYRGELFHEVRQIFNDWISQVIRIYKEYDHIEFEWLVGSIPIDDHIGKEIITRFTTNIQSNGIFYTDSNGREMIQRKRNHRDTWNLTITEEISGNYYPLTSKIAIEDAENRLAILVDRAQAGSSIQDGSIEIMIHRRLLKDDAFGVDEPLNETAYDGSGLVARGQHYLIFGEKNQNTPTIEARERFLQVEKLVPTWQFFSETENYNYDNWRQQFTNIMSGLTLALPRNLHLLTYEPWHENQILIRFEHLLEKNEDPILSKPVTFNLKDIFYNMKIESMRETTLDGNQWLDESNRLKFKKETDDETKSHEILDQLQTELLKKKLEVILKPRHKRSTENSIQKDTDENIEYLPKQDVDPFKLTINPMQIRTFIINLEQQV